jgi:hypothetical protein
MPSPVPFCCLQVLLLLATQWPGKSPGQVAGGEALLRPCSFTPIHSLTGPPLGSALKGEPCGESDCIPGPSWFQCYLYSTVNSPACIYSDMYSETCKLVLIQLLSLLLVHSDTYLGLCYKTSNYQTPNYKMPKKQNIELQNADYKTSKVTKGRNTKVTKGGKTKGRK